MSLSSINVCDEDRLIHIKDKNGDIIKHPLYMVDEVSLKFSSSYGNIWDATPNNLMNLLSSTFNFPSGQFNVQGMQIWNKTEPLEFSFTAKLIMLENGGYEDVVKPALRLSQLCLPKTSTLFKTNTNNNESNAIKKYMNITTLIPPGPNLATILEKSGLSNDTSLSNWASEVSTGTFNVDYGWLHITDAIIKNVTPTFSKVLDEDGFPTSATIDIEVSTCAIPTVEMVQSIIDNAEA